MASFAYSIPLSGVASTLALNVDCTLLIVSHSPIFSSCDFMLKMACVCSIFKQQLASYYKIISGGR